MDRSQRAIEGWKTRRNREVTPDEAAAVANESKRRPLRGPAVGGGPATAKSRKNKKPTSQPAAHLVAARSEDRFRTRVEDYGSHELLRLLNAGDAFKRRVALEELIDRRQNNEVATIELLDLGVQSACFKLLGQPGYPAVRKASCTLLAELVKNDTTHAMAMVRSGIIPHVMPLFAENSIELRREAKRLLHALCPSALCGNTLSVLHPVLHNPEDSPQLRTADLDFADDIRQMMFACGDPEPSDTCVAAAGSLVRRFVIELHERGRQHMCSTRATDRQNSSPAPSEVARLLPEYARQFREIKMQADEPWAAAQALATGALQSDRKFVERVNFALERLELCEDAQSKQALLVALNDSLVVNKRERFRKWCRLKCSSSRLLELLGFMAGQRLKALVTEAIRFQAADSNRCSSKVVLMPLDADEPVTLDKLLLGAARSAPKIGGPKGVGGPKEAAQIDCSWFDSEEPNKRKRSAKAEAESKDTKKKTKVESKRKEPKKGAHEFCFCRQPEFGFMIGCDGCGEWFHGKCVGLTRRHETGRTWKCPFCKGVKKRPED